MEKEIKVKDLVKGNIIKIEYGDYGNWRTIIVESVEIYDDYFLKVTGRFESNGESVETYARKNDTALVIGFEKKGGENE